MTMRMRMEAFDMPMSVITVYFVDVNVNNIEFFPGRTKAMLEQ